MSRGSLSSYSVNELRNSKQKQKLNLISKIKIKIQFYAHHFFNFSAKESGKIFSKMAISKLFSEICLFFNIPIFITHYIVSQLRSQGSIRDALFLTRNAQSPKSCPISHVLILFRIGFFRAAQGWGGGAGRGAKRPPP